MDAEMKVKWLSALRSGNFKQGQDALRIRNVDGNKFCCLGVLCEVGGLGNWDEGGGWFKFNEGEKKMGSLNQPTLREIGLKENEMFELIHMNDKGESFTRIADYIEANL